jgi:hypothetical protein
MGLIWQVIYYQRIKDNHQLEDEETRLLNGSPSSSSSSTSSTVPSYDSTNNKTLSNTKQTKKTKLLNWTSACAIVLVTVISCYNAHWNHQDDGHKDHSHRMNWLPQTMGWASAILYIGSRIPQIVKNWKNESTEGLSFGMFICAVLGNVLFTSVKYF